MRKGRIWIILLLLPLGCDSLGGAKVENPVVGPPPPRVSLSETESSSIPEESFSSDSHSSGPRETEAAGIVQVSRSETGPEEIDFDSPLAGTEVVATVNGEPIFAMDVLERHGPLLKRAEQRLSLQEYRRMRHLLIERDLRGHIQRKLLVQSLKETLKPEQLKMIEKQLDKAFEEEIERMKKEFDVVTKHELEDALKEKGTTLANLRDAFANQQLAREYLRQKTQQKEIIGRQDLLDYYRRHLDEYAIPSRVKWREIFISFSKQGGKSEARLKLKQVLDELRTGTEFSEVARRHSNGSTASEGGNWDWTRRGSLADQEVEQALFSLPEGEISQVFEKDYGFKVVKVVKREEAGHKPFEEVQDEIKKTLKKQASEENLQKVMDELLENAVINTPYKNWNKSAPEFELQ